MQLVPVVKQWLQVVRFVQVVIWYFFSEIKWSVTCRCISLRQGPTQLPQVVQLVQVVKLHLNNKGRGPANSYESFNSFKWWNCISLRKAGARSTRTSSDYASFFERMTSQHSLHVTNRTPSSYAYAELHEIEEDNMSITRSLSVSQTADYRVLKANCHVDYSFYWTLVKLSKGRQLFKPRYLSYVRSERHTRKTYIRKERGTRNRGRNMSDMYRSISVAQTDNRIVKANCYVDYCCYWSLVKLGPRYLSVRTKRASYTKDIRSKRNRRR